MSRDSASQSQDNQADNLDFSIPPPAEGPREEGGELDKWFSSPSKTSNPEHVDFQDAYPTPKGLSRKERRRFGRIKTTTGNAIKTAELAQYGIDHHDWQEDADYRKVKENSVDDLVARYQENRSNALAHKFALEDME